MSTLLALPDRAILRVCGADASPFLNGLLTIDPRRVTSDAPRPAALLTPQGKVLHAIWLYAQDQGFSLETTANGSGDLLSRLKRFRLRAKVELEFELGRTAAIDPHAQAPVFARRLVSPDAPSDPDAWRAIRIAAGLPEQGEDFGEAEAFPAEVNLDLLGGVDFDKGCFVGQEVVSRMHRRASGGRKRTLIVEADSDLASGAEVRAGDTIVGEITSAAGRRALACIRLDRWKAEGGAGVFVNGAPARLVAPDYMPAGALNADAEA